jgi:hypothetical protein
MLVALGALLLSAAPARATITDVGNVTLSGNNLAIGYTADGSRTVTSQTDGPYDSVNLGFNAGVTGTLSLNGATFATTGTFTGGVGDTNIPNTRPIPVPGGAVVDLSNGSRLETGNASLAEATITLEGGSSWINAGAINYGAVPWYFYSLPGPSISLSGGSSISTHGVLASFPTLAPGIHVSIDGSGTSWWNEGQLQLNGRSEFSLSNGATAHDNGVSIFGGDHSGQRVRVDGVGSTWDTGSLGWGLHYPDQEHLGSTLVVSNGGHIVSSSVGVSSTDSPAFIGVTGAGSKWSIAGPVSLKGDSIFVSISNGATFETGDTSISGFFGSVTSGGGESVSGNGSLWDLRGNLNVTDRDYDPSTLGVGQGARLLVQGDATFGGGQCGYSNYIFCPRVSIGGPDSLLRVGGSLTLTGSGGTNFNSRLDVTNGGRAEAGIAVRAADDSAITLHGGTIATPVVSLERGLLGEGTVEGDVTNAGRVAPGVGAGALDVTGSFTQTSAGKLSILLGGTQPGTDYAVLSVLGTSTLAGTLEVMLAPGYHPTIGDAFEVLKTGSFVGQFGSYVGLDLGDGVSLVPAYGPGSLVLRAVPEPGTALLVGLGLLGFSVARKQRRH